MVRSTCKVAVLSAFLILGMSSLSHATNYYVDSTAGNDSNAGTSQTAPWKSVAKVNSSAPGGSTVSFKAGSIWSETLVPPSGAAGAPTVYNSYGTGNKPQIKGLTVNGKAYITVDGFEIWNDNSNYPVYIYNKANHITVKNCYVWASSTCGWWAALYVTNASYNDFENNTVEHRNTSSQHDAFALDQGCSYNIIKNNTTGTATHYSLSITGASDVNPTWTSSYNYIGYNTVKNSVGSVAQNYTNSNNNVIEHNTFSGGGTADAYPTTFKLLGSNNIFRFNVLRDMPKGTTNGRGLRLETYAYGGTWPVNKALYNHVYNNVLTNIGGTEGSNGAIYVGTNDTTGVATNAYNVFMNNIVFADTLPYEITEQWNTLIHDNSFINNIVFRSGVTNVVYTDGSARSISGQQAYQTALWQKNLQTDPMLDSTLKPMTGSPALGGGSQMTKVTSAAGSGSSITVADAAFFTDGMGIVTGDTIQIGTQTAVVKSVNYSTKVLTLDRSVTWTQGQNISLAYAGSNPDIGVNGSSSTRLNPPTNVAVM
jgi:hypothetical protein